MALQCITIPGSGKKTTVSNKIGLQIWMWIGRIDDLPLQHEYMFHSYVSLLHGHYGIYKICKLGCSML